MAWGMCEVPLDLCSVLCMFNGLVGVGEGPNGLIVCGILEKVQGCVGRFG